MSGKNKEITEKYHYFWAQIKKAYFFGFVGNRTITRSEGVVQAGCYVGYIGCLAVGAVWSPSDS